MSQRHLCLCGLGNPGPQYQNNRHNLGFLAIERIVDHYHGQWSHHKTGSLHSLIVLPDLVLHCVKPQKYMNLSGQCLRPYLDYYKLSSADLIVFHDELDLPFGALRLKKDGSSAGHNGLKDIHLHLKTSQYWRVRLGIGRPLSPMPVSHYVLSDCSADQLALWSQMSENLMKGLPSLLERNAACVERLWHASQRKDDKI